MAQWAAHACALVLCGGAWGAYPDWIYSSYFENAGERIGHTATLLPNGDVLHAGGRGRSNTLRGDSFVLSQFSVLADGPVPATPMLEPRHSHTAVLLPTGRVLVSGGKNASAALQSQVIFDPRTGEWLWAGDLSTARAQHTATLLLDGQVLITGGENGSELSSSVLTGEGGASQGAGPLAAARYAHTAILLQDGKVLVAGGRSVASALASVEIFDPATKSWSSAGSMAAARYQHGMARLRNGKVLVIGGYGSNGAPLASCELFDPATGQWSATGALHEARGALAPVALPSGNVLAIGGETTGGARLSDSEEYHTLSGTWRKVESTFSSSSWLEASGRTAVLFPTGRVAVIGGTVDGTLPKYDGAFMQHYVGSASPTAPCPTTAQERSSIVLPDGRALLAGGADAGGAAVSAADIYDQHSQTWSAASSMTAPRKDHVLALLNDGRVMAIGGNGGTGGPQALASCEFYNSADNTWTVAAPMQTPRSKPAVQVRADGKVVVYGGNTVTAGPLDPGALASVEIYDPAANSWASLPSMPAAVGAAKVFTANDGSLRVLEADTAPAGFLKYDPATAAWTKLNSPSAVTGGVSALAQLANGMIFDPGTPPNGSSGGMYLERRRVWWAAPLEEKFTAPFQTALLHDGRVFGVSRQKDEPARLFDSLDIRWHESVDLPTICSSAVLSLPDGKMLLAGTATEGAPAANAAALYDPGPGYDPAWRPRITLAEISASGKLTLAGSGFRNLAGPSTSPADGPVVRLHHWQSNRSVFLHSDPQAPWTDMFFQSNDLGGFTSGNATAILYANGVPSEPIPLSLSPRAFVVETAASVPMAIPQGALILLPSPAVNAQGTLALRIANTGAEALHGMSAYVIGKDAARFAAEVESASIEPGQAVSLSLRFSSAQSGPHTARLMVASASAPGVCASHALHVTVSDGSPEISAIADQTVPEDGETAAIPFTIADPDTPLESLAVTVSSGNETLLKPAGIILGGADGARTLTLRPEPDRFGQVEVRVAAHDGSQEKTISFLLTIAPVNDPPSFAMAATHPVLPAHAAQQTVALSEASAGAFENDTLSFTAAADQPELFSLLRATPVEAGAAVLEFTPNPARSGQAVITVTLSDGQAQVSRQLHVSTLPRITPLDASAPEGNEGVSPLAFRLLIDPPHSGVIRIAYQTAASGAAVAGSDFEAASGTLEIPAGTAEAVIPVNLIGDSRLELDETFSLQLTGVQDAAFLLDEELIGAILNDDPQPVLKAPAAWVTVMEQGAASKAWIHLTLPQALDIPVTWMAATRAGTAGEGSHFTPLPPTELTFAPGETSKWIAIPVMAESANNGEKEFYIDLSTTAGPLHTATVTATVKKLAIEDFYNLAPGLYVVRFPAALGQTYIVQESASLSGPWSNASPILIGGNGPATQAILSQTPAAFFRVVTAPQEPAAPDLGE